MESPLFCTSDICEQRSGIRFLTVENIEAKNIHDHLKNVYGALQCLPKRLDFG